MNVYCCNGISHTPSQSCGVTIYIGSMELYLSLLWGLVMCLTNPCLSYCISHAIKSFLYSTNVLIVPFHSSTTLFDCICFKDTTYIKQNLRLWGMWSIPSLPLLSGPHWHRVVAPDRVLSMGQIEQTVCKPMTDVKLWLLYSNTWNHLTVCKKELWLV